MMVRERKRYADAGKKLSAALQRTNASMVFLRETTATTKGNRVTNGKRRFGKKLRVLLSLFSSTSRFRDCARIYEDPIGLMSSRNRPRIQQRNSVRKRSIGRRDEVRRE